MNPNLFTCVFLLAIQIAALQTKELPSDTRQLIADITPNFEANLKRAFKNEAVRLQRKQNTNRYIHHLDDVLLTVDDTKIELRNLRFPWIPDFRITTMEPDLSMCSLQLALNLGNLRVEGDYEANNTTLRKWLPVSHVGQIEIGFDNVKAEGRVGLLLKMDSLTPQNYDINVEPESVAVRVSYHIDSENKIENEITNSDIEATLGKTIWVQLTETISNLLHRQLAEAVVEFSVAELLLDRDEEYRAFVVGHSSRANKVLDSLLCSAKDYLVAKELRLLSTPRFDAIFKGKPSSVHQGTFKTSDGFLRDLSTLTRSNSFSLFENKNQLTIYGQLNLREFKHGYDDYHAEYDGTQVSGAIKGAVYKNNIFVKLTVRKEGERCVTHLDTIKVTDVKDIDIDISGLASLSWLCDRLKAWVIGNLRQKALAVLEKHLKDAFLHAIDHTDCVALLVD